MGVLLVNDSFVGDRPFAFLIDDRHYLDDTSFNSPIVLTQCAT